MRGGAGWGTGRTRRGPSHDEERGRWQDAAGSEGAGGGHSHQLKRTWRASCYM
jgi:hypothetical protein